MPKTSERRFLAAKGRPATRLRVLLAVAVVCAGTSLLLTLGGGSLAWSKQPKETQEEGIPEDGFSVGQTTELRGIIGSIAKDNTVVIAIANDNHRDFVMNWVYHVRATGITNFVIGAMDEALFQHLQSQGVPSYLTEIQISSEALAFRGTEFNKLGRYKARVVEQVTALGYSLLFSDIDAIFLRDPFPFLNSYPRADILCSTDHPTPTGEGPVLEKWREAAWAYFNIGFLLFRPSAHRFAQAWNSLLESRSLEIIWDQRAFNYLLKMKMDDVPGNQRNLFLAWDGTLKMGLLPVSLFCSGYNYFVRPVPDPSQVYVAHVTKVPTAAAKRHRLREAGLWKDAPVYFDHPVGFLSIELEVPEALLDAARRMVGDGRAAQMDLVNYQLKQVDQLLAWATVTGRTAILPRLWSSVDCIASPSPGDEVPLFRAPADQVLDMEAMAAALEEGEYGPGIDYREASFLERPEASQLAADAVTIELCQAAQDPACAEGAQQQLQFVGGRARLAAAGLSYERVGKLLEGVRAKVVRIVGLAAAASSEFEEGERQARFRRRLGKYAAFCCCNPWEQAIPRVQYTLGDKGGAVEDAGGGGTAAEGGDGGGGGGDVAAAAAGGRPQPAALRGRIQPRPKRQWKWVEQQIEARMRGQQQPAG